MLEYLLSLLPFYESRYVIPILILKNKGFLEVFFVSMLNLLVYPLVLIFLDKINMFFIKIKIYRKFYEKVINYVSKKKKIIEKYGYIGLFLLVFLPLPGTGVYTASILTWLLRLDRKKAILFISLGVSLLNTSLYVSLKFLRNLFMV